MFPQNAGRMCAVAALLLAGGCSDYKAAPVSQQDPAEVAPPQKPATPPPIQLARHEERFVNFIKSLRRQLPGIMSGLQSERYRIEVTRISYDFYSPEETDKVKGPRAVLKFQERISDPEAKVHEEYEWDCRYFFDGRRWCFQKVSANRTGGSAAEDADSENADAAVRLRDTAMKYHNENWYFTHDPSIMLRRVLESSYDF